MHIDSPPSRGMGETGCLPYIPTQAIGVSFRWILFNQILIVGNPMNFKTSVIAAALLTASAFASASTSIVLQNQGGNIWSAAFEGASSSNVFTLDLSTFASVTALESAVTANVTFGSGYNVTKVTFDGLTVYTADVDTETTDSWSLDLGSVTTTLHTITVEGVSLNSGKFTGSVGVQVTAVPEPETYALMLAGLGAVAFVARRRKSV
jgi:hypothetical protein